MAKEQRVFRANHGETAPYFIQVRKTAQDKRLSFEARGVISYILSKPLSWELTESDIRNEGGIGRDKCKRILDELEECGYLVKEQPRQEGKFLQNVYTVYEVPLTEKPSTVEPSTGNPTQDIIEDSSDNTDSSLSPSGDNGDSPEIIDFEQLSPKKKTSQYLAWMCYKYPLNSKLTVGRARGVNNIKAEFTKRYPARELTIEALQYASREYQRENPGMNFSSKTGGKELTVWGQLDPYLQKFWASQERQSDTQIEFIDEKNAPANPVPQPRKVIGS